MSSPVSKLQELNQTLSGQKLVRMMLEAAEYLEGQFGNKHARLLLGDVDQGTFSALKRGTASRAQIEAAVGGLVSVKEAVFRQQLLGKAVPGGIGGKRGEAAEKSSSRRQPGEKYRDAYGRLRTEPDIPHLDLPPVEKPDNSPLTGRDDHGRIIQDEQFQQEQAKRSSRNLRRSAGRRLME